MKRNTKMSVSEGMEAVKQFFKTFGAGIVAFAILFVAGLPVSAEQVLLMALLVALDKYFKDKGIYSTALKTVGIRK